eukprot:669263-Rhodomonas_salina.1
MGGRSSARRPCIQEKGGLDRPRPGLGCLDAKLALRTNPRARGNQRTAAGSPALLDWETRRAPTQL